MRFLKCSIMEALGTSRIGDLSINKNLRWHFDHAR